MKFGKFGKRLTAAVLTMTMAIQFSATTMQAAAASNTEYMSELILSYGKTDKEAKDWLIQNGYTVLNQNLNQGGEGGSDALSWLGLSSEKRSVYLGYKTTTDPKEAITDMKIMNMNGGYSYQAYEKILEETKQEKEHFLENLMVALNEYRDNYKAGEIKAQIAHDNLNKFKDDDSGQLMGDLLLNSLKSEDEAAYEADPSQHADMVTILMQGNSTCVSEIMQNLALGAGTGETSWLNAALANSGSFDEFFQKFIEERPGLTEDDAIALMTAEYDDYAKMFASSLVGLKNYLSNYTQSGLSIDATPEEADAYFAEHEFEKPEAWSGAANLFTTLSNVLYGEATLASYLVYTDDDFLTDTALLENYEDFGLPQRAKLYPFIAEMSAGERTLLEYTALDRMITIGLMDEKMWASTEATLNDPNYGTDVLEPCSMYANVNRDDFQVGSIAVTNMAQGKQASTGEEIDNGLLNVGITPLTAGLFIGGMTITAAGIAVFAKNFKTGSNAAGQVATEIKEAIDVSDSLIDCTSDIGKFARVAPEKYVKETVSLVKNQNALMLSDLMDYQLKGKLQTYVDEINSGKYIYSITKSGADNEIKFSYGLKIKYDANQAPEGICTPTGDIVYLDGRPNGVDEAVRNQYTEAVQQVNPSITEQLKNIPAEDVTQRAQTAFDSLKTDIQYFKNSEGTAFDIEYTSSAQYLEAGGQEGKKLEDMTQEEIEKFSEYMNENHPDSAVTKRLNEVADLKVKDTLDNGTVNENLQKVGQQLDDAIQEGEDVQEQLVQEADEVMNAATGSKFWKWFGAGMALVGLAMSVYSAWVAIDEMQEYYHMEMLPIPRKMVDISYLEDGSSVYVYYDCTRCNRNEMNMQNETLEDYGDMNGDVMKEWLALYTTKDVRAGSPIQAGFTKKVGTTSIPMGKKPLSFFGFDYAVNMTDERFTYNDKANGIYLYYSQSSTPAYSGTAETSNAYIAVGVLSAIGGAGICALMTHLTGKRKKKEVETV